jgi:DNA-binding Lrp family transcriptional regulator
MIAKVKCFDRTRQILGLLKNHGPLSFRPLAKMIMPAIKDKKLHASLSRMTKAGLIEKRHERLFRGAGVFYQISQNLTDRKRAATILACSADDLLQPEFRYRELLHTQECAIWGHMFKQQYPSAQLIRDFEFINYEVARQYLSVTNNEPELNPDLLIILPASEYGFSIAIGVEIERTRKPHSKIVEKLNKYANETFVDGVIYVCSQNQIIETVRELYQRRIAPTNMRVKHYAKHFFMFSDAVDIHNSSIENVYNLDLKSSSLNKWITYLGATSFNFRRDEKIKTWGNQIPHV